MAKIQAVWAIDVGQSALKALKLVPGETPDQVIAEAFDYIEYPKILSQPDADPDELVQQALQTLLERNDLKGCKVTVGVPGQAGLVKFIKLPPVEKKRIPDIVKFEARQQIPFALEEVIWDYQQIGDDGDGDEELTMAEVGLFAMKRDQINRAIFPFKAAGIEVDIVQMTPIALCNAITFDRINKDEKNQGSIVVMDIGADNTDLIITDGTRIWQRNVPIGGNHFTRALTKELKLTFAKAEHLKRNATKAPDPRSVFTAMRGVFNDISSEVSRSIGFYSSVNRTAKIARIMGLGNGFKLPGLQKFLQQNLNQDVEKFESFNKLTGDEVVNNPQFQENVASFAIAYGLALQGLGKGIIKTNLLPPEIEQTRLIRRKKPWALAASVLLLLGCSAMFMSDYRVWAKVYRPEFDEAVQNADQTTKEGTQYKTDFESAKTAFNSTLAEGTALVPDTSMQTFWPTFLKTINSSLPDPIAVARALKLDPEAPDTQPVIDKIRVHVDAIHPVYMLDVKTGWYDNLPVFSRDLMHPLDRKTPPSGEGWVVQLIGHHYNPSRDPKNPNQLDFGPWYYLLNEIIPRFRIPALRQFGVTHVTLKAYSVDKEWTPDKSAGGGMISSGKGTGGGSSGGGPIPMASFMLPRAEALKKEDPAGGGAGGAGGLGSMGSKIMSQSGGGMGGMGAMSKQMGASMANQQSQMAGMMGGNRMMTSMMGGAAGAAKNEEPIKVKTLMRTDFVIEFLWVPVEPGATLKPITELIKEIQTAEEESKGSIKTKLPSEQDVMAATKAAATKIEAEREAAMKKAEEAAKAAASATGAPAAGTPPAEGLPGGSAAPPAGGLPGSPAAAHPTGGLPGSPIGGGTPK